MRDWRRLERGSAYEGVEFGADGGEFCWRDGGFAGGAAGAPVKGFDLVGEGDAGRVAGGAEDDGGAVAGLGIELEPDDVPGVGSKGGADHQISLPWGAPVSMGSWRLCGVMARMRSARVGWGGGAGWGVSGVWGVVMASVALLVTEAGPVGRGLEGHGVGEGAQGGEVDGFAGGFEGADFGDGLAVAGDAHGMAVGGLLDEGAEVGFGVGEGDGGHGGYCAVGVGGFS